MRPKQHRPNCNYLPVGVLPSQNTYNMNTLENKTAYITGGSKGIGYGIAEQLMAAGTNVVITSRDEHAAAKAAFSERNP